MKNSKALYLIFITMIINLVIIYLGNNNYFDQKKLIENKIASKNVGSSAISMMYETEAGSGVYEVSTESVWPAEGYTFNETLSKCENGSTLTWNSENNSVVMTADISDKCYVYFDKVSTAADTIIASYTSQGANGLYLHDATLANSANDGSYRYAGASVNNYVCFGSDATTCPDDNLYRIIGVFGDQIKLIKSTSLWDLVWDDSRVNTWSTSTLNTYLNGIYLSELATKWQNMIATHTWQVGGMAYSQTNTAKQYYDVELNSGTTYSAKMGLMYVSDYGFAADPSYWTTELYNYETASTTDWMLLGVTEWTISRDSSATNTAFYVFDSGCVDSGYYYGYEVNNSGGVRPSFFLKADVEITSGSGTASDPYRLSEN